MLKRFLKGLDPCTKRSLRNMASYLRSIYCRSDLTRLAAVHGTDKLTHGYMPMYHRYFQQLRRRKINLLEIGIGGYADPWAGGNSLRMWASYFSKGQIFGIDIEDKSPQASRRITVLQGSQSDPEFLERLVETTGELDIVIDDGSHICSDVIFSFSRLFPHLKDGGIYVVEDTQTSYWEACGGSMDKFANYTTMNYFKSLTDGLNHAENTIEEFEPSYTDSNIVSIHFHHNLIVIEKGANNTKSNVSLSDRRATLAAS